MANYDNGRTTYTGGGLLFFENRRSDGTYEDKVYFGTTQNIKVTTSNEFMVTDNNEGCIAIPSERKSVRKEATISISSTQINVTTLAKAFQGEITDETQSAVTATAVTVTGAKAGVVSNYGYLGCTDVMVKDVTDTTTYVEGTDYEIIKKVGYIIPIDGGAITDGDELHLTVTAPAFDGASINAMKITELNGRFTFVTNSTTENNYEYTFENVSVTQDGDLDLKNLGTDATEIAYSGYVMRDASGDFFKIKSLPGGTCEVLSV